MLDRINVMSGIAVAVGAAIGALLRWWLSLKLSVGLGAVPWGTLAANVLGGYVIGLVLGYGNQTAALSPVWRLLLTTGFCGGLTTFSTFSAETFSLLQAGRLLTAVGWIAAQLTGSLVATWLGWTSATALVR